MGLFGITADEYQQCLTWDQAGLTVIGLWYRQMIFYENTCRRFLDMAAEDPIAAERARRAAGGLVQAAHEAVRRYDQIRPIPDAASTLHLARREALLSCLSWAEATLSCMEASANGTTPDFAHLESLAEKRRLAQDHAHEADKAFMRRIRAKAADTNAMVDKSISALAADPWEPKPTIHDIHLNLADGLKSFEQGDYATAIEAFQKCVDLDPTYQDAYAGLGGSYASLGQHARAIEAFRKVLDINPNHPETHYNLGCIYQDLGRYEDALTSYRAAAAARPDYALAYCKIGALALGFDRYKESAEALERAIELDPNLPDGLYNLASAYLHLGDYERAFEVCSRLMQTNPEHSDAQQLLAAIQKKQGEVATSCSHGENVP